MDRGKSCNRILLEKFFITGTKSAIRAQHAEGLRVILGRLNAATAPPDMISRGWIFIPLPEPQSAQSDCGKKRLLV